MIFNWKPFKIHLESLYEVVKTIPSADGISCDDVTFIIVEKTPFTEDEKNIINSYLDSLTEEGELKKIQFKSVLNDKIIQVKLSMVSKNYDELSSIERKLLLGIQLSNEDIASLIDEN